MTKTEFLHRVKSLLRGIVSQRRWLIKNNKGHIESPWAAQELRNIEHAVKSIADPDSAKAYIERKETALRFLIPTTNPKRHEQLRELLNTNLN